MKFTHSLQFNCVPEWSEQYLSYGSLKKAIYAIERAIATERQKKDTQSNVATQSPHMALEISRSAEEDAAFIALFESELNRVRDFYRAKERSCFDEVAKLKAMSEGQQDGGESGAAGTTASQEQIADAAKQLYVTLSDLRDYIELNRTGFQRIVQKYERYIATQHATPRPSLMKTVDLVVPPNESAALAGLLDQVEAVYAAKCTFGNAAAAAQELTKLLRARIVFERSTVWQDMVQMERKVAAMEVVENEKAAAAAAAGGHRKSASHPPAGHHKKTPFWVTLIKLAVSLLFFGIILCLNFGERMVEFHNGLKENMEPYIRKAAAVCTLSIMFWCLEVIPLFATAILVPFLATALRVLPAEYLIHHGWVGNDKLRAFDAISQDTLTDDLMSKVFSREAIAKAIFSCMFSPSVMLLIGGFSIASALSKHGIVKRVATAVLGRAGSNPSVVLFIIMAITTYLSMFISNVAAPVLVFTLVQPILRALGVDDPLAKSIVLGVAYAANIGGLTSTISSPQNTISLNVFDENSKVTLPQWLAASMPVSVLCLGATFGVLRLFYRSSKPVPNVLVVKPAPEPLTTKQWLTVIVSIASIALFVFSSLIEKQVGPLGCLAVIPLVAFFGLNLLGKDDFNGFMWNVVMIAMGGSAVGAIAKYSKLLDVVGNAIEKHIVTPYSKGFYMTVCFFSVLMLFVSTFVSHSVSSAVLAPLLNEIGVKIIAKDKISHANTVLVMVTCFICSIGMGMPISGFPNMTAMSIEDGAGRTFVNGGDFARTGLLASVFCTIIILTVGYGIFMVLFPLK